MGALGISGALIWLAGWIVWFSRQENDWEAEVLFNLTFGLVFWPLLALAQGIANR